MGLIVRRTEWTQQPQYPRPISPKYAGRVVRAVMPGLSLREIVTGEMPTEIGTAATSAYIMLHGNTMGRKLDLRGSTYGYPLLRYTQRGEASVTNNCAMIYVGIPGADTTYNAIFGRGEGSSQNLYLYYASGAFSAKYMDTSYATTTATMSGMSGALTYPQRFLLVKNGTTISLYDYVTRTVVSATGGNGTLNGSGGSVGFQIGRTGDGEQTAGGIFDLVTMLNYAPCTDEAWDLLSNPWQIFAP